MSSSFLSRVVVENLRNLSMADFSTSILPFLPHFGTTEKLRTMLAVDPDSFLVAIAQPLTFLGCLSGLDLYGGRAHMGSFFVHQEVRNLGVGSLLLERMHERLKWNNITMYATSEQLCFVKRKFEVTHVSEWTLLGFLLTMPFEKQKEKLPDMGIRLYPYEKPNQRLMIKIENYDRDIRDYPSSRMIRLSLGQGDVSTLVAMAGDQIVGYGSIRPLYLGGWRLGPLYADNEHIAHMLMKELVYALPPGKKDKTILIWVPKRNLKALKLVDQMGDSEFVYEARLCSTKHSINLPFDKIFAFRSTRFSPE